MEDYYHVLPTGEFVVVDIPPQRQRQRRREGGAPSPRTRFYRSVLKYAQVARNDSQLCSIVFVFVLDLRGGGERQGIGNRE